MLVTHARRAQLVLLEHIMPARGGPPIIVAGDTLGGVAAADRLR